jgi:hypothetical protein
MGWNMFGTPEQDSRYRYSRLIAKHLQFTDCEMFKSIRIITITTHSIRKSYKMLLLHVEKKEIFIHA